MFYVHQLFISVYNYYILLQTELTLFSWSFMVKYQWVCIRTSQIAFSGTYAFSVYAGRYELLRWTLPDFLVAQYLKVNHDNVYGYLRCIFHERLFFVLDRFM